MSYINKRIRGSARAYRPASLGDAWSDFLCSVGVSSSCAAPTTGVDPNAPVINVPASTDTIDTGPETQVATQGGQVSPIPSSSPGGGYTTTAGFSSVGGVCKPNDSGTLANFKELQRQANRVADAIGTAKIAVDGAIGPGTLALLTTIQGKAKAADTGNFGFGNFLANQNLSSCSAVAGGVLNITPMLSAMADALGVSSSVASPSPASTPTTYDPITGKETPQSLTSSIGDAFSNMSTTMQMAALGIAGGIGYYLYKGSKKKGKK